MSSQPVGGNYALTINGTPVPLLLGFTISEVANGRNRLDCLVPSDLPATPIGSPLVLTEDGIRIFSGSISDPIEGGFKGAAILKTQLTITAADNNSLPERRVLNLTFPSGTVKSWLQLILPFLEPYGVTLDPAQIDGPIFGDMLCAFMRVDAVLNQIVTLSNGTDTPLLWEIDYNLVLRMFPAAQVPAPFNVTEGDGSVLGDITVEPSQADYANRTLVLAGVGLHDASDTYTADGTTSAFPISNWVSGTRGYVTNHDAVNGDVNENISDTPLGVPYWTVDNPSATLQRMLNGVADPPAAGNLITFLYTGYFPTLRYSGPPGGVWPTPPGQWEKLFIRQDIFDAKQAQSLADGYLAEAIQQARTVRYFTKLPGLHPGMSQVIHAPSRHLDHVTCLITEVTITNSSGMWAERSVVAVEGDTFSGTWRDMIANWNSANSVGASTSAAPVLPSSGGGSGGGTPIGPGTPGKLAKWTGSTTIGDSIITESGSALVIAGDVSATSYTGSGAGLTNLPSSALTGTIPDARLSSNVVLKNAAANALAGNLTVGGTLGVTGPTTLSTLATTGAATIGTTLGVTGNTSLSTVSTTGAATLGSTLAVTGATTLGGTLGVTGNTSMAGSLHFTAPAGFPGSASIYRDPSFGFTTIAATGTTDDFTLINPSGANIILAVPTGTSDLVTTGALYSGGYVSGTTGWRITNAGSADFRALTADQLHVKVFTVDQERALAGGELIAKSVAVLAAAVTMPAYGVAVTITVQDLAGAPGMPVFAPNDWVMLRVFTRAGGALTVADAYGQVTAPTTGLPGNTQSWTWTRGTSATGGSLAASTTVPANGLAIDFGVSGQGFYEVQAADGAYDANGPYAQIVTWTTAPVTANRTLRTRFGNLFGITNVANEFGLIAGTYATSNGQFFRASNTTFELHGIDLLLWDGTTNTVKIDHAVPYFAMGSPRPASYTDGVAGLWFGKDAGVYKFRLGTPGGSGMSWDGSTLSVVGAINVTGGNAAKTDLSNVTGAYAGSSSGAGGPAKWVAPTVPVSAINGAGLYLGSNIFGFYDGGAWRSYLQSNGVFVLQNSAGANGLVWDGTNLTITGAVTATSGTFTGTIHASAGTIGGFTIDSANISNANVSLNATGLVECINGSSDAVGMTSFGIGGTSTIRFWVGNGGGTVRNLMITTDGSLYSNGTLSAVVFSAGSYYLAQQGPNIAGYSFINNVSTYWGSDSTNRLAMVANNIRLFFDGTQFFPETSTGRNLGHPSFQWGTLFVVNVTQSSDRRLKTDIAATRYGTAFVRALRPVDYTMLRDGARGHGFIAQDVAALAPEFGGIGWHEGRATGLNYSAFLGPLVRAFQELDARVAALEGRQ